MRQQGKLSQLDARLIRRQITAGLKGDRAKCAAVAAEKIKEHLAAGEPKEAWQTLKGWYNATTNCTPKASKMSLAAQTAERVAQYGRVASKGDLIHIHMARLTFWTTFPVTPNSGPS
jgi:hypothetical protein